MADFDQVKAYVSSHLSDLACQLCNFHLKNKRKATYVFQELKKIKKYNKDAREFLFFSLLHILLSPHSSSS